MICAFTGHRPEAFSFGLDETDPSCCLLKRNIKKEIAALIESGATSFITGMALGVDTWCAEAVLELRESSGIALIAALPYPEQSRSWSEAQRERYFGILERCNERITVSSHYSRFCMFKRNRYMIERADTLLAVWNGSKSGGTAYTLSYAKKLRRRIIVLDSFGACRQ